MTKDKFDDKVIHQLAVVMTKKPGEVNFLDGQKLAYLFQKLGFKKDRYSFYNGGGLIIDGKFQHISRLKYVTDRLLILNKRKNLNTAISEFIKAVKDPSLAQKEINALFDSNEEAYESSNNIPLTIEINNEDTSNLEEQTEKQNEKKYIVDPILGKLPTGRPIIFISYSQDSEEHMKWVKKLGDDLSAKGLFVLLDQYNDDGTHLPNFMIKGIAKANKVLIIGTENYKKKFDNAEGGASFEDSIINGQIYQNGVMIKKFIPCLRQGTFETSFPEGFPNYTGYDFRNDKEYNKIFKKLSNSLWSKPNSRRPKLGDIPSFVKDANND